MMYLGHNLPVNSYTSTSQSDRILFSPGRYIYIYIKRMRWASRMAGGKHSFTTAWTPGVNMADLAIGEIA